MRSLLFVAFIAVAFGAAILPEDLPKTNVRGECPSGLPLDGLFNQCSLKDWRIGSKVIGGALDSSSIDFTTNFANLPSFLDFGSVLPDNSASCSIRFGDNGVVYQHLPNLLYAHYRLIACAKVHGATPCRVEVRNHANHIVDYIEFAPLANMTCTRDDCVNWSDASGWDKITIRYEGLEDNDIFVVDASTIDPGFTNFQSGLKFSVKRGEEFVLSASDFAASSISFLPDRLAFFSGSDGRLVDMISLAKGKVSVLPGERFGDDHQFLLAQAHSPEGWVCSVSEAADPLKCSCMEDNVEERCMASLKGFDALPEYNYYIGMSSESCDCSFDSICLHQVGNEEGYFGVPWILNTNSSSTSA